MSKNKKNTSELAFERDNFLAEFSGCLPFDYSFDECSLKDYDDSIAEINMMIDYCISINNESEIHEWRKMLQRTKMQKRLAKSKAKMIEKLNTKELATA